MFLFVHDLFQRFCNNFQIPVIFSPDAHHPNTISHRCTVFFGFLSVQEYNLLLYLLLLWQFQFVYPLRQSSQYILLCCFFLHRQADLLQDRIRLKMHLPHEAVSFWHLWFCEPVSRLSLQHHTLLLQRFSSIRRKSHAVFEYLFPLSHCEMCRHRESRFPILKMFSAMPACYSQTFLLLHMMLLRILLQAALLSILHATDT